MAKSISSTLHVLLGPRYNRQVRPEFGVKPVKVELNLSVLGIGPVDEMTQVAGQFWTFRKMISLIRFNLFISVLHARLLLSAILG